MSRTSKDKLGTVLGYCSEERFEFIYQAEAVAREKLRRGFQNIVSGLGWDLDQATKIENRDRIHRDKDSNTRPD